MTGGDLSGTDLEQYHLIEPLGRGGMGVVYLAEDQALRRRVAVKVLAPALLEDRRARQRFQTEINHAARIEHPHIVPVYSAGYDNNLFYLVLRLINGPDIGTELTRCGRFGEARALRLLGQVASALAAVHRADMVHRDVKPANVMIGDCGERDEHAQLTDFGIAKALDDTSGLTGVGPIGTPAYMAPEVCLGRPASPQSDQYSLACMAYEMLAGLGPYSELSGDELRTAHAEASPRHLTEAAPGVSSTLAAAIHRGLAKNPGDRFLHISQLIEGDRRALASFETANSLASVVANAQSSDDAAVSLIQESGWSDSAIATFTDGNTQGIARLRRRAARAALLGPPAGGRAPKT